MEQAYFDKLWRMFDSQLQEEQANYNKALAEAKEKEELNRIKQRIKSLDESLRLIESASKLKSTPPRA